MQMRVLITGGTGSFGQAMTAKLLKLNAEVTIFSRDELKQYEMSNNFSNPNLKFVIGDVRDEKSVKNAVRFQDIIIHAAALKQVGVGEKFPDEVIKTNVLGTQNVVESLRSTFVDKAILISSDKAVAPINMYGASKMCAEKLFLNANLSVDTIVVRYGNVVGSRGSVIPAFKKMAKEGVIKITDVNMTRFWITLDQATDLVLRAIKRRTGGEILIPKIPSMRITDLADAIDPTAKQEVIGIRPGEKLHEVLISPDEYNDVYESENDYIIWTKECYFGDSRQEYEKIKPITYYTYSSNTNTDWLSVDQLRELIKE
jgi:UDP-N-acetylglucosamine 4,6-dehydratase/5-epimerase